MRVSRGWWVAGLAAAGAAVVGGIAYASSSSAKTGGQGGGGQGGGGPKPNPSPSPNPPPPNPGNPTSFLQGHAYKFAVVIGDDIPAGINDTASFQTYLNRAFGLGFVVTAFVIDTDRATAIAIRFNGDTGIPSSTTMGIGDLGDVPPAVDVTDIDADKDYTVLVGDTISIDFPYTWVLAGMSTQFLGDIGSAHNTAKAVAIAPGDGWIVMGDLVHGHTVQFNIHVGG